MKPLKNNLIIKPNLESNITSFGLHLVKEAKEKPETGQVIHIGNEVKDITVGDTILFKRYAPDSIKIDGTEYLVIKDTEVMAIIENVNVEGTGYGRESDMRNHALDILQPFNKTTGKVNEQFVKVYGDSATKEISSSNSGKFKKR